MLLFVENQCHTLIDDLGFTGLTVTHLLIQMAVCFLLEDGVQLPVAAAVDDLRRKNGCLCHAFAPEFGHDTERGDLLWRIIVMIDDADRPCVQAIHADEVKSASPGM